MKNARKAAVAVAGLAAQALNAGLVPDKYQGYVAALLALATAAGVYSVPNANSHVGGHVADS